MALPTYYKTYYKKSRTKQWSTIYIFNKHECLHFMRHFRTAATVSALTHFMRGAYAHVLTQLINKCTAQSIANVNAWIVPHCI